jgi:hypothetical protein
MQLAAGIQPYSIKIGDTWYSYARLQPVGTLMGLAADMAQVWEHLTPEESDKLPKMLSVAFANAVTNQTFLQGISNIVHAISEPDRFGPRFVQGLAGSVIPGAVAQTAQLSDPLLREVNSTLDAVRNRIPGWREGLLPKRDAFGEPIANRDRVGVVSPITASQQSGDKVRIEAVRLGVGVADAVRSIQLPSGGDRKLGEVELTPEQRDVFRDVSGRLAHEVLSSIVNGPAWDGLPDVVKKRIYDTVFERARKAGSVAALPAEARLVETLRIQGEIARRLTQ